MSAYTFMHRISKKLPVLEHFAYGVQIWVKIQTRKDHRCAICHSSQEAGTSMFRPVTNGTNRWERICPGCMHRLTGDSDGRATT